MRQRTVVLFLLCLLAVILYLDRVCISVALPRMQEELGIAPERLGWVSLAFSLTYALFEIAKEAFGSVSDPHNKAEVAAALHKVNYTGMCGQLNFAGGPAPGVGIIQPIGVQWKQSTGGKFPYEMKVVDNSNDKSVPIEANLVATNP